MSIISALFDSKTYNFEQAFGVRDITSNAMKSAIRDWHGLYYSGDPNDKEDPCQRLPVAIVSKLYKTTFSEYSATTKNVFAQAVLDALNRVSKKAVQNALIGGECFLKPIFTARGLAFSTIERRNILVLGRDEQDEITSIGTAEKTVVGKLYYTLLERRTVDNNGYLTIESKLYRSDSADMLGVETMLSELDKYAALEPVLVLPQPVGSLGLVPVRTPLENCVDGSPDCVSVYAPAARLIHLVGVNEAQINGEFERGKSRLVVSGDLLKTDSDGRKQLKDDIFTALDDDPDNVGVTIFSPAFREQSFLARKQEYLRNIESLIGLKRGILSEVEAAERTATEITSSAGDYNLSIIDFQVMWENAVREAVRVCGVLGKMYKVTGADDRIDTEKDISVSWGNGILYDEEKTGQQMLSQVQAGLLRPEIYLGWYYDMPTETDADLQKIREKYMPEVVDDGGGDE